VKKRSSYEFFQCAKQSGKHVDEMYYYTCIHYLNKMDQELGKICGYMFTFGIVKNYTIQRRQARRKFVIDHNNDVEMEKFEDDP